jgi:hypothetical protein
MDDPLQPDTLTVIVTALKACAHFVESSPKHFLYIERNIACVAWRHFWHFNFVHFHISVLISCPCHTHGLYLYCDCTWSVNSVGWYVSGCTSLKTALQSKTVFFSTYGYTKGLILGLVTQQYLARKHCEASIKWSGSSNCCLMKAV